MDRFMIGVGINPDELGLEWEGAEPDFDGFRCGGFDSRPQVNVFELLPVLSARRLAGDSAWQQDSAAAFGEALGCDEGLRELLWRALNGHELTEDELYDATE
jgi:hypothetical protein